MTQIEIIEHIQNMCNKAGRAQGVSFVYSMGDTEPGVWSFVEFSTGGLALNIVLKYHGDSGQRGRREVLIPWPPTDEDKQKFIQAVSDFINSEKSSERQ